MKKLIGTVAVAALLATAAFADGISFGSWGRGLFQVGNAKYDGDDSNTVTSWLGQSWGGAGPRTALVVNGSSENVGFSLDLHGNGSGLGIGDNALIWVKPIDAVKVVLAAANDSNWLRSDAAFGLWNWDRIGPVGSEDEEGFIFPAILNKNLAVAITPIEGLFIGVGINSQIADSDWGGPHANATDGKNANNFTVSDGNRFVDYLGRTIGFAASYTIADIGTIKAGVQGQGKGLNKDFESKDLIEIDAAFELTAIENVYIALGAKVPLMGNYNATTGADPIQINVYGRLGMIENLTINLLGGFKLNSGDVKEKEKDGAVGFRFGGEVEYAFSNGISVFGEVSYANGVYMVKSSADNQDTLGFGVGLWKGFSNGLIGVAFQGATNAYGRNALNKVDDLAWEVPVKFEYWF